MIIVVLEKSALVYSMWKLFHAVTLQVEGKNCNQLRES